MYRIGLQIAAVTIDVIKKKEYRSTHEIPALSRFSLAS
jgi:hypothetical protein